MEDEWGKGIPVEDAACMHIKKESDGGRARDVCMSGCSVCEEQKNGKLRVQAGPAQEGSVCKAKSLGFFCGFQTSLAQGIFFHQSLIEHISK